MDHDPVRTILADDLPTAFESACLVQCTDITGLQRRPDWYRAPAPRSGAAPALAEFNRREAALRLAALLSELGYRAHHEVRTGGGWRRYEVERVTVAEPERLAARQLMATAWLQGRRTLLGTDPLGSSSPRNALRIVLASAAWRSALLAAGRGLRGGSLWVRFGDNEIVTVLVRAARLLGVTADVVSRPGCVLVTVPATAAPQLVPVRARVPQVSGAVR